MEEITSLAVPFHRSHYYSFQGEVWDLPSGQKAHIYVKPTYIDLFYAGPLTNTEVSIYVVIGTIDNLGPYRDSIVGIRAYVDVVNYYEYEFRLDCEYDDNGEVEEYMIGLFNGLVEELNSVEPLVDETFSIFRKWGLDFKDYEV